MASKHEDFDDVATWPARVETYFINLLLKESNKGLHTSTLDEKTWKAINNDMSLKFGRSYAIPKLKSKFNRLRKMYREFSMLLSETGARYDAATNVVHASDDVWEAYLKKSPSAKRYRRKGCNHYNLLDKIFKNPSPTSKIRPHYTSTPCQSDSEDEQQLDEPETGADDTDLDANIADTNESGTSATAARPQAISPLKSVRPTKQPRSSEHVRFDNTHGAWTNNLSSKIEPTLGQSDQFHKNNEILSSGFDPYSVAECMDKLESIPNVANVSYFKAMERFLIPEWRQMFIKMSDGRRCMWLESLKN